MADVSACNGSDGSSLTVSGPRPLRGNEPRPITQTQALSPAPRADSAAVRTPNPNPGPRGPQSLPSEDHRTIKAHGRWNASGQEVMSHPSVTSKSHVTHTMTARTTCLSLPSVPARTRTRLGRMCSKTGLRCNRKWGTAYPS